MSDLKTDYAEPLEEEVASVFSRWQKRKQGVLDEQEKEQALSEEQNPEVKNNTQDEEDIVLTDADMPPIESLTAESDFTGFLSPKVSEALRKMALRKLFHGAEFNIRDGLDEYDGDYTKFEPLGDLVTSDMKFQIEMEARKKAEQAKQALVSEDEKLEESTDEQEQQESDEIKAQHEEDDINLENEEESLSESEDFDVQNEEDEVIG